MVSGLNTAGCLRKWAATTFKVPESSFGRIIDTWADGKRPFKSDEETCATASVYSHEIIVFTSGCPIHLTALYLRVAVR